VPYERSADIRRPRGSRQCQSHPAPRWSHLPMWPGGLCLLLWRRSL